MEVRPLVREETGIKWEKMSLEDTRQNPRTGTGCPLKPLAKLNQLDTLDTLILSHCSALMEAHEDMTEIHERKYGGHHP